MTAGHLGWPELVFVIEKRHLHLLQQRFRDALGGTRGVPVHSNDYECMDDDLIARLRGGVPPHIDFGEAGA